PLRTTARASPSPPSRLVSTATQARPLPTPPLMKLTNSWPSPKDRTLTRSSFATFSRKMSMPMQEFFR
ncbi:MAG: hypothetical protein M1823_007650, partial [Watsoniomyces obsoletus]